MAATKHKLLVRSRPKAVRPTGPRTLPKHLQALVPRRLGTLALIFAAGSVCANVINWATDHESWATSRQWSSDLMAATTLATILSTLVAGIIWALARTDRLSERVAPWVARGFTLLGALAIAFAGHVTASIPAGSASWVCVWIILVPVVVPSPPKIALTISLLCAATVPLSAGLGVALDAREPLEVTVLLMLTTPAVVCAVISWSVAKLVHDLGQEAGQAVALGAYELVELLGRGGMGEVWRARHRLLARPAAVKLVRPDTMAKRSAERRRLMIRRFEREAYATAALNSPHTVKLYDFGVADDGTLFYVMELLDGVDLQQFVQRHGPMAPERVVHILIQACNSLADAHKDGLVHRDIKPGNITICRVGIDYDFVKVLDFGLVYAENTWTMEAKLTADGAIPGTPAFLSPEQALPGEEAGPRSDIYSLGCVAYWLLTGLLVFDSRKKIKMIADHVDKVPVRPSVRGPRKIPRALEDVVMNMLEKLPHDRPQSADALAKTLRQLELPTPWDQNRAKLWWATHMPSTERHLKVMTRSSETSGGDGSV